MDPRDHVFRKMIVYSGIVHAAALLVSAVWMGLVKPPHRVAPVAVVNLIGGAQFERLVAHGSAARPKTQDDVAPAPPIRPVKATRPEPARRARAETPPVKVKIIPPAALPATRDAMPPPDTSALSERIRNLREARTGSERIREAAREAGREKAYLKAIGSIRERAAHRIDLTQARPAPRGAVAAPAVSGGAPGTARISPEQLRYFHELDQRVRENWTLPELAVKDSSRLMVQLRITIERDGRVSEVHMEQTSGNSYFDDSVKRAIKKASPVGVPPETLRGGENYYEVGFRFFGSGGAR